MSKLRIITLLGDILLLIGVALAMMSQAGSSKVAWIFLPWFVWPYVVALYAWWHGKKMLSQIMTLIFIIVCAVIQGQAYGSAFIWHLDSQSAYGWFMSPLYCVLAIALFIPNYIERLQKRHEKKLVTNQHSS